MPGAALGWCGQLASLDLARNNLSSLAAASHNSTLSGLASLRSLNLSSCSLHTLAHGALRDTRSQPGTSTLFYDVKMHYISLDNRGKKDGVKLVVYVPGVWSAVTRNLTSLTSLDLGHNLLRTVPTTQLASLASLRSLVLSGNLLQVRPRPWCSPWY